MSNRTELPGSLTSKVIRGGGWMLAVRLVARSSGVVVTLILARLLNPEAYGLVAIGTLAISLFSVFTEVGFKQALIRESDEDIESMLQTAWSVELIRGILISTLLLLNAPWIANFFQEPAATSVIRVLAFTPFLSSLTSIRIIYLQKELEFRKQFFYEISGLLGPLLVSVPLAFLWRSVWALVAGSIASVLFQVIMSYWLMPFLPTLEVRRERFEKMFRFGKWIFLGSIVSYFAMELDTYVVGWLFDTRLLGIYVLAFSISNKPVVEIGKALSKVLFPAYAKIGNDPARVRQAFLKSSTLLYATMIPLCLGLNLVAYDLVYAFLSSKWHESIPVIQILALAALLRSFAIPASGIFLGIGHPKSIFYLSSVRLAILISGVTLIIVTGLPTLSGIAITVLLANGGLTSLFIVLSIKQTPITAQDWRENLSPLVIAAILMILSVALLQQLLAPSSIRLFLEIIVGATIYIGVLIGFWYWLGRGPIVYMLKSVQTFLTRHKWISQQS